jgi:hypothetical protein
VAVGVPGAADRAAVLPAAVSPGAPQDPGLSERQNDHETRSGLDHFPGGVHLTETSTGPTDG